MDHLDCIEAHSIYILREAFNKFNRLVMLWSLGKDSNVMLWLAKKAFFGHVPCPVLFCDTGKKFPEMYSFQKKYTREWDLDFIRRECPPIEEIDPALPPSVRSASRKTEALKRLIDELELQAVVVGIRRDEESTRAKERVFSPRGENAEWDFRDQPPEFWDHFRTELLPGTHIRIHPLLHWTELDVWLYIQRESIPLVPLYFARDGKRYRSLGDMDITKPVNSKADTVEKIITELLTTKVAERTGRMMDHETEDAFEMLRSVGYM
ncbi:putative ATP sulfurylase small subunit [Candidatus Endolissoclinum faulkneri L5]|uniref:Sulfate adenylyltransferase subunit 2 n=1 Tax=Candidatus Endolissoclinum faulkneri L5 TaxID=1401328 RepID=V9TTI0_9PROT|nr:sulfate adenylyltransferase subunit CysD [Candidatus Endolissoclinum faulkneri]AHC73911.1 putative ATP sulfurylase small subunit [Candidatus Endolissoclinum faulkneri L5]